MCEGWGCVGGEGGEVGVIEKHLSRGVFLLSIFYYSPDKAFNAFAVSGPTIPSIYWSPEALWYAVMPS